MIKRIVFFIFGVLLSSYSLMLWIIYLNLLKMGYSFLDYLRFIFTNLECLLIFLGILLIYISLRRNNKYELCI